MSTYVPIQTIRITSDTATITFTGIPQTYTDLVIVGNVASSGDDLVPTVRVGNGTIDSGSNYSQTTGGFIAGAGIASFRDSNDTRMRFGRGGFSTTQPVGVFTLHFQNYSNTTTNKTVLARNSAFDRTVSMCVGTWRSTSAINTIQFTEYSGATYVSGSTFTLYGIGSGSPKAFGGNEVRTDGTYWYHIFRSSGRFEPVQSLSCDYLVVAGGGGGRNGGGGAGGLRSGSAFSTVANQALTVTVGAGGTGASTPTKGGNSVFGSISATGGGRASTGTASAANGGSGGGASDGAGQLAGTGNEGGYSPSEGNNGGTGASGGGGGGGGAGALGGNATTNIGGNGGNGTASSITGTSVTYAGGGGAGGSSTRGTGGTGGGGNGESSSSNNASEGTANTGGGGGGGWANTGKNGGSGIVIVRYAV
jgi:hypothetical protein